jgi:hypothetical protein
LQTGDFEHGICNRSRKPSGKDEPHNRFALDHRSGARLLLEPEVAQGTHHDFRVRVGQRLVRVFIVPKALAAKRDADT